MMPPSSSSAENLSLLSRLLGPSEKVTLLRDVLMLGPDVAAQQHLDNFFANFPSLDHSENSNTASFSSWDYQMPNGSKVVVNMFQDGPLIHVNSDRLQPIRYWVVKRLFEDGNILVDRRVRKDPFFSKKYYKVYELINLYNYRPLMCYS